MEQLNLFTSGQEHFKINSKVRLIELFAGIGSQSKALERLGIDFENWVVCEFDEKAIQSYNAIHGTNFPTSDITKLKGSDLSITETDKYTYILTYSFPCQDLSLAGKQRGMKKGSNTRSSLLFEVERLLNECIDLNGNLPQVLLMENVPQVHSEQNREDFRNWIGFLESIGYNCFYQDLNAKDYGISQNRERTFMVSVLGDYFYEFPSGFELKLKLKDMLEDDVDKKYYLSDKMIEYISADNEKWTGNNGKALINKDVATTINTCEGSRRCDASNYISNEVGENYNIKINDANNLKIRKLTPKECWRLMGFGDEDFEKAKKVNSNTQLYKQAGNSIVVDVLYYIFKQMI